MTESIPCATFPAIGTSLETMSGRNVRLSPVSRLVFKHVSAFHRREDAMWIRASDALSENIFQIAIPSSSHYLIVGECSAIIDAGVTATGPELVAEIEAILGVDGTLEFVLLTHAHFDHCGGVAALRSRWPELEVFASPATSQLLEDKAVLEKMYAKNKACAEAMGRSWPFELDEFIELLKVDRIMGDGDVLDLGADVEIKMIDCPGHASDLVAFYIRPDCALFGGEAVGQYNGRDQVYGSFNENYADYLESLERLATLDIRILGFSHSGSLSGELVGKYFQAVREHADRFKTAVRERVEQGELQDEVFAAMLADWRSLNICPDGPFVAEQEEALRSMIRAAAQADVQAAD